MDSSEKITLRIMNCLPAGTFELEAFCQLVGLRASLEIESAAVECGPHPRMLINPEFVDQYCQRDEHLFLLVMHELWHILLGHARLFPRSNLIDNIAFDAIINAGLALQFPGAEYRGFFEELNAVDVFPNLLLRPPGSWPKRTEYPDNIPPGTADILERLYHPRNAGGEFAEPLYEEIRDLLLHNQHRTDMKVLLLGDHTSQQGVDQGESYVREVVREVSKKWPNPPMHFHAPGGRKKSNSWSSLIGDSNHEARRVFGRVIGYLTGTAEGAKPVKDRWTINVTGGSGVFPNPRDRLWKARQMLGLPSMLWMQPIDRHVRKFRRARVVVYLDVSASMFDLLPDLLSLLIPFFRRGEIEVYQFSGEVVALELADLEQGNLQTSRGTDINCVLEHIIINPFRSAVILTDGYTGSARVELLQEIREKKIKLHLVFPDGDHHGADAANVADTVTVLPGERS